MPTSSSLFSPVAPSRLRNLAVLAATSAAVFLAGCAVGTAPTATDAADVITGTMHGGNQPVTGATIALYATIAGGYNTASVSQAPTLLGTATTGSNGAFSIARNATTCPAGQQVYALGYGGNPGLSGTVNNTALVMMAAIGPCTATGSTPAVSASTQVTINEVTTVAAAYALSGFVAPAGAGLVANSVTSGVATSSTNQQGLNDAFANAANIVNVTTGTANTTTSASGSTGVVPFATINSLADILQDCVNSNGAVTPSTTPCAQLFTAATPPGGSAPVNTLQAAINIAQNPGSNVSNLFNLTSSSAAFMPNLPAQPNDWTLGVTYTATNLVSPAGLAIDATDNVYTVGYPTSSVALLEFNPQGSLLSPSGGWNSGGTTLKSTDNVRDIKIDPSGNLFLSDGNVAQIFEYTPAGTATSPTAGTLAALSYATTTDTNKNNWALAIDGSGDVFVGSYKQNTCSGTTGGSECAYVEFPAGSFASPTVTFGGSSVMIPSGPRGLAADTTTLTSRGQIWATANNGNTAQILIPSTGATTVTLSTTYPCSFPYGIAIDASGNAWIAGAGNTAPTGTTGTTCATVAPSQLFEVSPSGTVLNTIANSQLNTPFYVTIDGAGNIFTANTLGNTVSEYSPTASAFLSPNVGFAPNATYNSTTTSVSGGSIVAGRSLAVDRSGALWVLNPGAAGALVQILGVAAPVNPVLSSGGLGVKP